MPWLHRCPSKEYPSTGTDLRDLSRCFFARAQNRMSIERGVDKMVANQNERGTAASVPVGLATGLGISLLLTVIMAALTAWLEGEGVIQDTAIGYGAMLTLLVSALFGALTAAGKIKRQRAIMCAASGLCYFLSLICITALFFGGQYEGVGVSALLILGASAAAIFLPGRGGKSTTVRVRKLRNR